MRDDAELLRQYVRTGSEDAFAELVHRHLPVVYSSALRQTDGDAELAKDICQTVFIDLGRKARSLLGHELVIGWLFAATRFTAADMLRANRRRQNRESIAASMHENAAEPAVEDPRLTSALDAAMAELPSEDRNAVLLRFFQGKPLKDVGAALGINEDAARMRVSRALDRLHGLLKQRGVTLSVAALGTALAAQAVTAVPTGLAATITAAALAGTTLATTATATTAKAIAMTTLQKTLVTATIIALAAGGVYEARQSVIARAEVQTLQQQQAPLTQQIQQLQRERDESARQLASFREERERLSRNTGELLKLRAEVTRLRNSAQTSKTSGVDQPMDTSNPLWKPNWIVFRPFDLTKFPDSQVPISGKKAKDVGISSPAALLQTWIWAQRTGDSAGLLKTWDFPDGTTEEQKMEHILSAQKGAQYYQEHPDTRAETSKLHDLFDIGNGYYLALIEEEGLTTTWIGHQYFRHMGDEWKVSFGRQTK